MQDGRSPYFGATVGRVANRIAGAKFVLNGVQYNLSANDPPNSLHGGKFGWSRKPWTLSSREVFDDGGSAVKLKYTSVDGEEVRPQCPCCMMWSHVWHTSQLSALTTGKADVQPGTAQQYGTACFVPSE